MGAVFLSGCGGSGGGDGGQITDHEVPGPKAVLMGINDPSRAVLPAEQSPGFPGVPTFTGDVPNSPDYSPVGIHVTYTSPLPASEIIEYHVYRPDFITNPSITATGGEVPGQVAIYSQSGGGSLDFWDDGTDRPVNYHALNPDTGKLVSVTSTAPPPVVAGTGIKTSLNGKRFAYTVEVLVKIHDTYALTKKSSSNMVTYLQPALLTSSSFTGVTYDHIHLNENATLGADDYILELSSRSDFADKKTIKPYDPSLIQVTSAIQNAPRRGVPFSYFDPNTGFDMSSAFPGAPLIFARMGVRDSADGTSTTSNPYLYSETTEMSRF